MQAETVFLVEVDLRERCQLAIDRIRKQPRAVRPSPSRGLQCETVRRRGEQQHHGEPEQTGLVRDGYQADESSDHPRELKTALVHRERATTRCIGSVALQETVESDLAGRRAQSESE